MTAAPPVPFNPAPFDIAPRDLGLPPKFTQWRPGQLRALTQTSTSESRFIINAMPTGGGKAVLGVAAAILQGGRACILTSTKLLQDQYTNDGFTGMVDIRGRHNYQCSMRRGATCGDGRIMGCKSTECPRAQAVAAAKQSRLIVTNYPCYLHSYANGEGLGEFDMLICDEAHNLPSELCDFLEIKLDHAEYEQLYFELRLNPPFRRTLGDWVQWARFTVAKAKSHLDALKQEQAPLVDVRRADAFHTLLTQMLTIGPDWIMDEQSQYVTFSPLWPTEHAERLLFRGIKKVLLLSATIVPKIAALLNIKPEESLFLDHPYQFDPRRCPIYLYGASRIDYRSTAAQLQEQCGRMDTLISRRLDRKGIGHTVSYQRQSDIFVLSRYKGLIIRPSARDLAHDVEEFRQSPPPRLIFSPALTTGYDFPGPQAEYTFILKVPFIDARGKLMSARNQSDPEYLPMLTAQTLIQTPGRAMRSPDDQNETFILDKHANWFIKQYRHLFTHWWLNQVSYPSGPPIPPPALSTFNPAPDDPVAA